MCSFSTRTSDGKVIKKSFFQSQWRIVLNLFPEHAEADTFFCFSALMAEIGDLFTKKLDSAHLGIGQPTLTLHLRRLRTSSLS